MIARGRNLLRARLLHDFTSAARLFHQKRFANFVS